MAQQYENMYQEYPSNRSPGRGYNPGLNLNRQTSRHFENNFGGQIHGLYTQDDHVTAARYDSTPRYENRIPSSTIHSNYPYESQTWNNYGGANGGAHTMGGTGRMKHSSRRAQLPSTWIDHPPMPVQGINYQQQHNGQYGHQQPRISPPADEDELIPTAIVIKNIPFAVKKEQLVSIMTEMGLPLPYAFNYHFDNGVFRGLAFANFTTAEETSRVILQMNHLDLQGRKLRVEYKKMLPAMEREKIEREKRERRGQLEEQHRPLPPGAIPPPLNAQSSMTSMNSGHHGISPSPVSTRGGAKEFDLNDPITLDFYNELLVFKNDANRESLIFPTTIQPQDRRTIHTLAHHMGLEHRSEGEGPNRCVSISKSRQTAISPPPSQLSSTNYYNESRRGVHRAATIDFSEARETGYHTSHPLRSQGSGLLDIPGSPGMSGPNHAQSLRAAKSFADLRSYSPSPVPSASGFGANLAQNVQNISRYADYGHSSAASGTPNLTPTSQSREDYLQLANNMSNLNMYERPSNQRTNAGAIGSQRPVNGNSYDENPRNGASAVPERQPRGPPPGASDNRGEWNAFSRPRQNGHVNRGSDSSDRSGPLPGRY